MPLQAIASKTKVELTYAKKTRQRIIVVFTSHNASIGNSDLWRLFHANYLESTRTCGDVGTVGRPYRCADQFGRTARNQFGGTWRKAKAVGCSRFRLAGVLSVAGITRGLLTRTRMRPRPTGHACFAPVRVRGRKNGKPLHPSETAYSNKRISKAGTRTAVRIGAITRRRTQIAC